MAKRYFPKSTEELVHFYERYISPISLIAGFLADNFILLKRVDLFQTNALLFSYLVVAALGIILLNLIETGRVHNMRVVRLAPLIPVVMQFSFGGLLSGYLSLYSRSASLAVSWIFIFAIAALVLGNERFMRFYTRFAFQIVLYFTVLFSFLIFFLPVVFRQIGPVLFLLSGSVSLFIITLFLWLLQRLVPGVVKKDLMPVGRAIVIIFVIFNAAYFFNLIPPLPLAIREAGVYHSVARHDDGTYQLLEEPLPWYESFLNYNVVYHASAGEAAYVYTAVFAPSGLSTTIVHEWQEYDETTKQWRTTDTVHFSIAGGRDGGYRGYSVKTAPRPGKWRVNVLTAYGQIISRVAFTVVPAVTTTAFVTYTR